MNEQMYVLWGLPDVSILRCSILEKYKLCNKVTPNCVTFDKLFNLFQFQQNRDNV